MNQTETSKKTLKQEILELLRFTLIVLAIVIPIRVFIAQPFIVNGESMVPTLQNGDYLIIDEISYRTTQPERGEVIVFRYPTNHKRFLIKRIIGLPGESRKDMLDHARKISLLPIQTLKLHQLQIIKHTMMAIQLEKEPEKFELFTSEEYIDLITEFIALLRPDIIIERFISESPAHLLLAPKWNGMKNFEIVAKIDKKLIEKDLWQGKNYEKD